jgi:MFS superfamily sulfate permease-like transporter
MALLGARLLLATPWLGALSLLLLLALLRQGRWPAAPLTLLAVAAVGWAAGAAAPPPAPVLAPALPSLVCPTLADAWHALGLAVLPQLPLTLTNAVLVTAVLARELFPNVAPGRVSERRLCLSTGLANLLAAPLGAMPMCHGAGGLQAQHRFGARTGAAPVLLGVVLVVLALGFPGWIAGLFASVPPAATGALLLVAGADLAWSRRLVDARPDCWLPIGATALATLLANPALGLACGWALEAGRGPAAALARKLRRG